MKLYYLWFNTISEKDHSIHIEEASVRETPKSYVINYVTGKGECHCWRCRVNKTEINSIHWDSYYLVKFTTDIQDAAIDTFKKEIVTMLNSKINHKNEEIKSLENQIQFILNN